MSATYDRFPCRHVWRAGLHCRWEITDGIGGRILAAGTAWTRGRADSSAELAQLDCKPSRALRLEWAADRLTREGLPVAVRIDEQDRVCVRFLCPCSTRDEVRVLREFLALTADVRREVR